MKFASSLFFLPALAAAVPTALSPRQANLISIINISASGTGCPAGTFTADISPDNVTATLGFSSYHTFIGPGVPTSDRDKNCDVFFSLQYPVGCTNAVFDVSYHGFAQLESGVTGTFSSTYNLSPGTNSPSPPATSISGPVWLEGESFLKEDGVTTSSTIRNPSQRRVSFTVRNRLQLRNNQQSQGGSFFLEDLTLFVGQQAAC